MSKPVSAGTRDYIVKTERFGDVTIAAFDIADARRDAKERFGVGPRTVSAKKAYAKCDDCDSAPCTCSDRARQSSAKRDTFPPMPHIPKFLAVFSQVDRAPGELDGRHFMVDECSSPDAARRFIKGCMDEAEPKDDPIGYICEVVSVIAPK